MSTTQEKPTKTCPQCDGAGQEEIGIVPIVCRKCAGLGKVEMRRTASVLEKVAQSDFDSVSDGFQDEDVDDLSGNNVGTGFDALSVVPKDTSDGTLRMEIVSLLGSLPDTSITNLFERILIIMGSTSEEVRRQVAGANGKPNDGKIEHFVYTALDGMNRRQLCSTLCEARKLV